MCDVPGARKSLLRVLSAARRSLAAVLAVSLICAAPTEPAGAQGFVKLLSRLGKLERLEEEARTAAKIARAAGTFERFRREAAGTAAVLAAAQTVFARIPNASELRLAYLGGHASGEISLATSVAKGVRDWSPRAIDDLLRTVNTELAVSKEGGKGLFVEMDLVRDGLVPLDQIDAGLDVVVVFPDGALVATHTWSINGELRRFFSLDEGGALLTSITDNAAQRAFFRAADLPFHAADVHTVVLLDRGADGMAADDIARVVNERNASVSVSGMPDWDAEMARARGKLMAVVGHNEDGVLTVLDAYNQPISQISVEKLMEKAALSDVELLLLSCDIGVRGMATTLNTADAATQLDRALQARSYGAFLAGLGTPERPFVVAASQVERGFTLEARRLQRGPSRTTSIHTVQRVSRSRQLAGSNSPKPPVEEGGASWVLWVVGGGLAIIVVRKIIRS